MFYSTHACHLNTQNRLDAETIASCRAGRGYFTASVNLMQGRHGLTHVLHILYRGRKREQDWLGVKRDGVGFYFNFYL